MDPAAGEAPEQEAVDRAEGQLAGLRTRAHAVDIVEDPGDLRAREVRVESQAGLGANRCLKAVGLQRLAIVCRAPVLPHDGIVNGLAGVAIPNNRRLTLVRDADSRDIARGGVCLLQRAAGYGRDGCPDRFRVVFHPAGPRIDLRKFLLVAGHDAGVMIINNGAAAARALVDGKQVLSFHESLVLILNTGCLTRIRRPASSGHGCCP